MRLVMALVVRGEAEIVDAQIAYHLNAGVDHVIATDLGSDDATREILDEYARHGCLTELSAAVVTSAADAGERMRRVAATQHGADWVLVSEDDEFWWPRDVSLKDTLAPIPPRYSVVQALVRVFSPRPDDDAFFAERMTVRPGLQAPDADPEPLPWALQSVYRARVGAGVGTDEGPCVPLRAWYPIEVLRFPFRTLAQAERVLAEPSREPRSRIEAALYEAPRADMARCYADLVVDDERLARGLADGSLVVDERLGDGLRALRRETGTVRRYALPAEGSERLVLPTPSVVDDAAYAVECAALGEVDLVRFDQSIRELENRIALLEQRLWPRVVRTLSRVVRR